MLKGKTAIITGAGRGIGRAVARRLAAAGANVVVAARNEAQLEDTCRIVSRAGGRCLSVPTDVTDEHAVEHLVDETIEAFGRVDILINNAGVAPMGTIEQIEPDQFDHMVAVNIRAVYLCCRAVWPAMVRAGSGSIVNISSVAAEDPFPGFAAYGGTKAFVNTFSKALATEGRPSGIRVHCVAPGAVDTDMLRGPFPEFPAEKTLDPDQVAAFIETLLGPTAAFTDGQTIAIRKL